MQVSSRCTIEFCELQAIDDFIDDIVYHSEYYIGYTILLMIDNEVTIKWIIQNYNFIHDTRITKIILNIYKNLNTINQKYKINIFMFDVNSHTGVKINELADRIAKIGLSDTIKAVNENSSDTNDHDNWQSINISSIKKEIKRIIKLRTQNKWIQFRDSKKK
eukprot:442461_1